LNNRIPFEQAEAAKQWELPSLGAGRVVPSVKKKSSSPSSPTHSEKIEQLDSASLKPLTAEDLAKLVDQAEQEGRQSGFKQGFETGYKDGELKGKQLGEKKAYDEAKQSLTEIKTTFETLCNGLFLPVESQHKTLERIILEMVIQATQHLIGDVLSHHPILLVSVIEKALSSLPVGNTFVKVYIHPDDLKLVRQQMSVLNARWHFIEDVTLARGGVRVETEHSLLDFSVQHRMAEWMAQSRLAGDLPQDAILELIAYPETTSPSNVNQLSINLPEQVNITLPSEFQVLSDDQPHEP
jgi:flagellar assembly protein FliH